MTIKELEEKLKITEDTAIHCQTLELAKKVLDIFHKLGLTWCNKTSYIECIDWDSYKENTIYYPFEGRFASLKHFQQLNGKIISAEEFIDLHTEEFDLENYVPKGDLIGFPKEIIARMLDCQEEQGNQRDITVFEKYKSCALGAGGFVWDKTEEKWGFWFKVIGCENFNVFFEKYPKKEDTSQEFRVGDKVIDIIRGLRGRVVKKYASNNSSFAIYVDFDDNQIASFTLDGKYSIIDKYPRLLHYRDDYDYTTIDFNNLPKRQEENKWRAEVGEKYYYFNTYFEVHSFIEEYHNTDTKLYNLGDYFKTEEEAQKIADQMNTYFQKLIKI